MNDTQSLAGANSQLLPGLPRRLTPLRRDSTLIIAILIVAVVFNLYAFYPEAAIQVPNLNDDGLHRLAIGRAVVAIVSGQDPTDTWMASASSLGYPLFHNYQNLPYLLPAAFYLPAALLSGGALSLAAFFDWLRYGLLALFPLSIFWSMRRFGFERVPSALAALLGSLIATNGLLGFEYGSYSWRGGGVYTQLWGMLLLPPALAQSWVYLRQGRGFFWAVVLLAATALSHLIFGYMAAASVVVLTLLALPGVSFRSRVTRLGALGAPVAVIASYFLLPILLDGAYHAHSTFEPQVHFDSYGAAWVLGALVRGELFDYARFPALTLLAALGLLVCLSRWREPRYRVPVVLFGMWLVLFFGRPTWGALLDVLPLTRELTYTRLISGVHLGGIMLAGIGLYLPWSWAWSYRDVRLLAAPALLTVVLLFPVYQERLAFMSLDAQWMGETRDAYNADRQNIEALVRTIQGLPPGRVYAGLPATWGINYKIGGVPLYDVLSAEGLDVLGYPAPSWSLNTDPAWTFDDGRVEQYNLFNVRYVITPVGWTVPAFYKTLGDFGKHRLYQVETTGYFDLVDSTYAFYGTPDEFFRAASLWQKSNLPRLKQHPGILFGNPLAARDYPWLTPLSQAATVIPQTNTREIERGTVLTETVQSNAYTADVEVQSASTLILKATYYPHWHALVDGVETRTTMVMPSYVGVALSPGTHHVRIEYRPPPYRYYLMLAGLLALLLVALADRRSISTNAIPHSLSMLKRALPWLVV